ncbi:MAG: hypothetical protein ACRDPM_26085 [Solirubrobacteraceae bacterium]
MAILTAAAVGGCGLGVGGSAPSPTTTRRATGAVTPPATTAARAVVARAQRTHEIPTPAPPQTALGGWRSPVQAVEVFAQIYINWTARTVASHLRVLAQAGVGQARSAMTLAAAQVAHDSSITLGGIANSGTVEAIAPVTGERNVYAVVTRERTTATNTNAYQGLRPAWHVTLATVTAVDGRLWTISGWQPEN